MFISNSKQDFCSAATCFYVKRKKTFKNGFHRGEKKVTRENDFILPGSMRFVYFCLQIHATQHKVLNHLLTTRSFTWILTVKQISMIL